MDWIDIVYQDSEKPKTKEAACQRLIERWQKKKGERAVLEREGKKVWNTEFVLDLCQLVYWQEARTVDASIETVEAKQMIFNINKEFK